jgi:hypothetical protein
VFLGVIESRVGALNHGFRVFTIAGTGYSDAHGDFTRHIGKRGY